MELPHLPPKPRKTDFETPNGQSCLPKNIKLLPFAVVKDLLTKHQRELQDYVLRLNDCQDIEDQNLRFQDELKNLLKIFESTETRRRGLEAELNSLRKLEAEYEAKWENLNNLVSRSFSNDALAVTVQNNLETLERLSSAAEASFKDDVDQFINQFLELRKNYHAQRKLLHSWNKTQAS
ncbi:LAQU0S28e00364g1_1 [Lachancea quebecensis]|uniref:LAQU0S28e00364g1_1 n=1 Tax=Lachancea quebecensis TaxID=1654605 RepID=A0A0P1KYJ0_9SACH|nr:LAQU0S28e00364g1_1 [Lachancea quebecensis]